MIKVLSFASLSLLAGTAAAAPGFGVPAPAALPLLAIGAAAFVIARRLNK